MGNPNAVPPRQGFTDAERQKSIDTRRRNREDKVYDAYFAALEAGCLMTLAATKAGITVEQVRKRRSIDPTFAETERQARAVGAEPVEQALREAALKGNVPAALKWLERYSAETWAPLPKQVETTTTITHALAPGTLDLLALEKRLKERQALARGDDPDIIDI